MALRGCTLKKDFRATPIHTRAVSEASQELYGAIHTRRFEKHMTYFLVQLDPYSIRSLIGMMQSTVASTAIQLGLMDMDKRKSSSRRKLHGMHRSRSARLERPRPLHEETDRHHSEGDAIHEAHNHDGEAPAKNDELSDDVMRKTHSLPEEALRRELRRRRLSREGSSSVSMGASSLRSNGTKSVDGMERESSHRPALLDAEWLCLPYYFIQGFCELTVRTDSRHWL
jgi:hypothetical protein